MIKNQLKNIIGWSGSILVVANYLFLTLGILEAKSFLFNFLQVIGGSLLAIRVYMDRNYSNLALEFFFIAIGVYALIQVLF